MPLPNLVGSYQGGAYLAQGLGNLGAGVAAAIGNYTGQQQEIDKQNALADYLSRTAIINGQPVTVDDPSQLPKGAKPIFDQGTMERLNAISGIHRAAATEGAALAAKFGGQLAAEGAKAQALTTQPNLVNINGQQFVRGPRGGLTPLRTGPTTAEYNAKVKALTDQQANLLAGTGLSPNDVPSSGVDFYGPGPISGTGTPAPDRPAGSTATVPGTQAVGGYEKVSPETALANPQNYFARITKPNPRGAAGNKVNIFDIPLPAYQAHQAIEGQKQRLQQSMATPQGAVGGIDKVSQANQIKAAFQAGQFGDPTSDDARAKARSQIAALQIPGFQ